LNAHHLILGELDDFLTGKRLPDTHDERLRQKVAVYLVETKAYEKSDIIPGMRIPVRAGKKRAVVTIDYTVTLANRTAMIIKYGPGSLVTRHQSAWALTRLAAPYQVPLAVVTNGMTADLIDGPTGRRAASGFSAIPSRNALLRIVTTAGFNPIPEKQVDMASRIAYTYEIDDTCPCDDSVCRLEEDSNGS